MLDWSYELLAEPERLVLRRLAIFAGGFTMRAALEVLADEEIATAAAIVDYVSSLVTKSLVTVDVGGATPRYRLLDTTRAYAMGKLRESGKFDVVARRHAEHYLAVFEGAEAAAATLPSDEWLPEYGPRIDNARAALDWAFSPAGHASIGIALTAGAVPLWMQLSRMEECRVRVQQALAAIAAGEGADTRREMQLHAALGSSLIYTRGDVPKIGAAWTKALEIAESLGDVEYQLRSLWGLWNCYISGHQSGSNTVSLMMAQTFHDLAASQFDRDDCLIGERMIATVQYHLGDLLSARRHIEHVLEHKVAQSQKRRIFPFVVDNRAAAQLPLARILWLQGLPDQAMRAAESGLTEARATNHAISVGQALARRGGPASDRSTTGSPRGSRPST